MPTGEFWACTLNTAVKTAAATNVITLFINYLNFKLQTSDTQLVKHVDETLVKPLVGADALGEGHIDDVVVAISHHDVTLSLFDGLNGSHTHATGQDAVAGRRTSTTLQVSKDGPAFLGLFQEDFMKERWGKPLE